MNKSPSKSSKMVITALSFLFLLSLVFIEYFLFHRFFGDNSYFKLWLERGPLIAISVSLIALVWKDLDKQHPDLVSSHPGYYLIACFQIMSGVFLAFTNSLPARQSIKKLLPDQVSPLSLFFDSFIGILLYIFLFFVAFAWLLCVAPTMYFITLITGAPARLALLNNSEQIRLVRTSTGSDGSTINEWFALSFRDKPFTVTSVLTTGLLTLIKVSSIAM